MLARNTNAGGVPTSSSKSSKSNQNFKPPSNPDLNSQNRSRNNATKKSVIGVSNISVSIRSTKKATDRSAKVKAGHSDSGDASMTEKGIQVDEIEIIATDCREPVDDSDEVPVRILTPSPKVIREVERARRFKKEQQLKARLSETRHFEEYEKKQEAHITNLQKFLDTGSVERKREESPVRKPTEESPQLESNRTKEAIGAYDRVKQREEELLKLFNSI